LLISALNVSSSTLAFQISRHIADLAELRTSLVIAGEEQQAASAAASDITIGEKSASSGTSFTRSEDKESSSESATESTGKFNLPGDDSQSEGSGNKKLKEKIAKKKASTIASNYVEAIKVADEFTALLELLLGWLKRVGNTGFKRQVVTKKQLPIDAHVPESKRAVVPEWSDEEEDDDEEKGVESTTYSGTKHCLAQDEERGEEEEEEEEEGTAPLNLRPMQHDDERGLSGGSQEAVHLVTKVLQLKNVEVRL